MAATIFPDNPNIGDRTFDQRYEWNGVKWVYLPPPQIPGDNAWTPVFAIENDGARRVLKVVDWINGDGTKPQINVYVGATNLVPDIEDGIDIRGSVGAQGIPGNDGLDGADGLDGSPGRGITSIALTAGTGAPGTIDTYTITFTDATTTTFSVYNGADGADGSGTGMGDVVGPSSSVNNNIAVFDGTDGKLIKDGGTTISDITTSINGKQAELVSGTNIKTINSQSLLGSGNITISSGLTLVPVTTNSVSAAAGNDYALLFAGATTVTAPPTPTSGQKFGVMVCNELLTNVINWNGEKHENKSDSTMALQDKYVCVECIYIDATYGWKVKVQ